MLNVSVLYFIITVIYINNMHYIYYTKKYLIPKSDDNENINLINKYF